MVYQFGIYANSEDSIDHWSTLISLHDSRSPRTVLRELAPFLREFHARQDMGDIEALAAWLVWYLIDAGMAVTSRLPRVSLSRNIRGDTDFFYKISPGLVEVYCIDELLEWQKIAALEIPQEPVELGTR